MFVNKNCSVEVSVSESAGTIQHMSEVAAYVDAPVDMP